MSLTDQDLTGIKGYKSGSELSGEAALLDLFHKNPIPERQVLENLGLFLTPKNFARILFMHHIYRQIVDVQGAVFDLGTRWGQNLALFSTFRGMYEPFNRHRKVIGFDTFEGFPGVDVQDGGSDLMRQGNVSVTPDYDEYLGQVMGLLEQQSPLAHIKKYELVKGDATETVPAYLEQHPETIIALAYFDFDLYRPTRVVLEAIKDRVVKGSVLGFDELNDADSPGETTALNEVFGLNSISLKRLPTTSRTSYFVVD